MRTLIDIQVDLLEDLLKESGRGIILMKHFCKDVIFDKTSIELIMEL